MTETSSPQPSETPENLAGNQGASAGRLDVLEQLLKPEVQESLTVLVDNLPKLTEMLTFMTKAYDFGKSVATDPVLAEDTMASLTGFTKPVTDKVKNVASAAIEAGDRIHEQGDQGQIGLFGLMKMLKDPQVQKALRFTQAFMDVLNEREKQDKR
ncbi:DUF1641 domain-containing protein [Paenibacillus campinasensis]|uniref:DUF1641 domain-containing protein n=1 Tax=Paenibacillus campinasensis TaxID=66347 RepID=A0ABW9T5I1_9BACL|nr:DUF1641 domain-containing protein [Paenibacillus campinasensis]MUG68137.1 DUF1641 domain-containing protein [Paenibacillus campinasensis]